VTPFAKGIVGVATVVAVGGVVAVGLAYRARDTGAPGGAPAEWTGSAAPGAATTPDGTSSGMPTVAGGTGVTLDVGTVRRVGIETAPLHSSASGAVVILAGELVPDSGRIVTVRAPLAGRLVVDGARWPALGEMVTEGRVLGHVSDARPLAAPRGGTVTRVGAQPGEMVQAGAMLLELTDFRHPLARLVWRADAPPVPPASLTLAPLAVGGTADGRTTGVPARLVGPAPEVDPLSREPVYLYRAAQAWPGARPGAPVVARFADRRGGASGPLVPTEAVVQWEGLPWVYVERAPGRYERVRVETDRPAEGGGYLVGGDRAASVAVGDLVVVRGTQQLLSEEFRAHAATGEAVEQNTQ
jgi:hypothetical protein